MTRLTGLFKYLTVEALSMIRWRVSKLFAAFTLSGRIDDSMLAAERPETAKRYTINEIHIKLTI